MQRFENPFSVKLRARSTFVGEGTFSGKLYRVDWYPAASYLPGDKSLVWGEIYRIFDFDKLIPELDEYEEVLDDEAASLYWRQQVPVQLADGQSLVCWTYLYNRPTENLPVIEGGRFSKSPDLEE